MTTTFIAFPRAGHPYMDCLYGALDKLGIHAIDGHWSGKWLIRHVRRGTFLHFHWPSFNYQFSESTLKNWASLLKFVVFLFLIRCRGGRIIWTAHNLYPHRGGDTGLNRVGRRAVVWASDIIFVHGRGAGEVVAATFGARRKLRVIHHGHFIGFYPNVIGRAEARRRLDLPPEAFVHLFFGRCSRYKNLETLVTAFRSLNDGSMLVIAGEFQSPDLEVRVRALAAADPHIRIHARFVPDDEVQVFLNAADIVVLPYAEVLTSGAAMLALSYGKPVIAPRLGAIPDHVDAQHGVLYEPGSDAALADAMRDARRRRFDSTPLGVDDARFSWDAIAAETVAAVASQR